MQWVLIFQWLWKITPVILLFLSIYIYATSEFVFPLRSDYQRPQQEGKQMKLSVPILFLACQTVNFLTWWKGCLRGKKASGLSKSAYVLFNESRFHSIQESLYNSAEHLAAHQFKDFWKHLHLFHSNVSTFWCINDFFYFLFTCLIFSIFNLGYL